MKRENESFRERQERGRAKKGRRNFALFFSLLFFHFSQSSPFRSPLLSFHARTRGSSKSTRARPLSCKQPPWHRTKSAPTVRERERKHWACCCLPSIDRWRRRCFDREQSKAKRLLRLFVRSLSIRNPDAEEALSLASLERRRYGTACAEAVPIEVRKSPLTR